jgi:hypothetical protein
MKRSIGPRVQAAFFTGGGSDLRTGWKDQKARCSGVIT